MENSSQPWAQHDATLPFTRMLAGLADYTPVHFGRAPPRHDLGAPGRQCRDPHRRRCWCTAPTRRTCSATRRSDIVKSIPSVWDETIVLPPSEIGDLAVFARAQRRTWFVAAINGTDARTIRLDLPFLKGNYRATMLRDTGDAGGREGRAHDCTGDRAFVCAIAVGWRVCGTVCAVAELLSSVPDYRSEARSSRDDASHRRYVRKNAMKSAYLEWVVEGHCDVVLRRARVAQANVAAFCRITTYPSCSMARIRRSAEPPRGSFTPLPAGLAHL